MKSRIFLCIFASMSAACMQAGDTSTEWIRALRKKDAGLIVKSMRNGCINSYGQLRSTCVNASFLARSPKLQKYMQENFGAVISTFATIVAVVVGGRWFMNWKRNRDVRRADEAQEGLRQAGDSAFIQDYRTKPERTLFILGDALLNYNNALLELYNKNDQELAAVGQQIGSDEGLVMPVSVRGYSQPVLQVTLKGNATNPLALTIRNNLEEHPVDFTFVTPYKQDEHDTTGLVRLVGSTNRLAIMGTDLIAPYLAWMPKEGESKNTHMCMGEVTVVDTINNSLTVQELPDELEESYSSLAWIGVKPNTRHQALLWPRPVAPYRLEAPALFGALAEFIGDYILLGGPRNEKRTCLVSVDYCRPRQVISLGINKINTQDDDVHRITVEANDVIGNYSLGFAQDDNLSPDGLFFAWDQLLDRNMRAKIINGIAAVHAASTDSKVKANVIGKIHNGAVDYRILRADGVQLWSSAPITGSSSASTSNASQQVAVLPDLINNWRLDDGSDEADIMARLNKTSLYYATLKGLPAITYNQ